MNNERYNQIVDEAYKDYRKSIHRMLESWDAKYHKVLKAEADGCRPYTQETFINKCKTDKEFSEKWGLKIIERELSLEERVNLLNDSGLIPTSKLMQSIVEPILSEHNIPTKLITLEYNGEKIETERL